MSALDLAGAVLVYFGSLFFMLRERQKYRFYFDQHKETATSMEFIAGLSFILGIVTGWLLQLVKDLFSAALLGFGMFAIAYYMMLNSLEDACRFEDTRLMSVLIEAIGKGEGND